MSDTPRHDVLIGYTPLAMPLPRAWPILMAYAVATAGYACSDPGAQAPRALSEPASSAPPASSSTSPADGRQELAITPDNTRIEWTAAKVTVEEHGYFRRFSGVVRLDPEVLTRSEVEVRIETASLYAEPDRLADHLRDEDFLGADEFPEAVFRSLSLKPAKNSKATHLVSGELTLHGHTRRLTFPARITLGERLKVDAQFAINRMDFAIAENRSDHFIRELVVITLALDLPLARP